MMMNFNSTVVCDEMLNCSGDGGDIRLQLLSVSDRAAVLSSVLFKMTDAKTRK